MIRGYYFITDSGLSKKGNMSDVRNAVEAGIEIVQYRNKNSKTKEMLEEANRLRKLCKDIIFLINDRVDIAIAVNADGVHLGNDDMPYDDARRILGNEKIIGLTVHNVEEAVAAEKIGADYIGLSPIFSSSTKSDAGKPCGIDMLRKVKRDLQIPIVAIGGITLENAKEVIEAGADALCAISAVVAKDNVINEAKKFQELFK